MGTKVMAEVDTQDLSVYVVWVPRLGGTSDDVSEASSIMLDPRALHYWDGDETLGWAYRDQLGLGIEGSAWDIYFLYDADTVWGDDVPVPSYWEHQLDGVTAGPQLDGDVFRGRVLEALRRAAGE